MSNGTFSMRKEAAFRQSIFSHNVNVAEVNGVGGGDLSIQHGTRSVQIRGGEAASDAVQIAALNAAGGIALNAGATSGNITLTPGSSGAVVLPSNTSLLEKTGAVSGTVPTTVTGNNGTYIVGANTSGAPLAITLPTQVAGQRYRFIVSVDPGAFGYTITVTGGFGYVVDLDSGIGAVDSGNTITISTSADPGDYIDILTTSASECHVLGFGQPGAFSLA